MSTTYNPSISQALVETITGGPPPPPPGGALFDYILTIPMENQSFSNIIGPASYVTSLANAYSLLSNYTKVSSPSEGNYVGMIAGATYGFTGDCGYCPDRSSADTICQRIVNSGRTVKLFAEDASGSGTPQFQPPRGGDHFAFITFSQNNQDPRIYQNYVSASSPSCPELISHLNSGNPANYLWLTPNDQDNMHDSSVSFGDNYLSNLVPNILSSTLFQTKRAVLNIVWDENGSQIASVWIGNVVKRGFVSGIFHDHYSYCATIEAAWGLANLGQNDASATPITEVFQ